MVEARRYPHLHQSREELPMRNASAIRGELGFLDWEYRTKRRELLMELYNAERLELNLDIYDNKSLTEPKFTPCVAPSQASL
jgi:hypothetical protein